MTNLDARMGRMREEMEERYLRGDKDGALEISRRLDRLIALAQREVCAGERILFMIEKAKCEDAPDAAI